MIKQIISTLSTLGCIVLAVSEGQAQDTLQAPIPDGTYQALRVVCSLVDFEGAQVEISAVAQIDGTFNNIVAGNTLATQIGGDGCSATSTYRINKEVVGEGLGLLHARNGVTTTSTGRSCNAGFDLVPVEGERITPSRVAFTTPHNVPADNFDATYITDPDSGFLAVGSAFRVADHPLDLCFIQFRKAR